MVYAARLSKTCFSRFPDRYHQRDRQGETTAAFSFFQATDLFRSASNRHPFGLTAGSVLAAHDFRQRVAAPDAMQESEGVANVALAARVRAHDYGERADA